MPDLDLKNIDNSQNKLPDSSAIKKSSFNNFLSTLFGWRRTRTSNTASSIEFTKVDIDAENQRIGQALINNAPNLKGPMSQKLEELFNIWLTDNTDKYADLQNRAARINQLEYMVLNDPYVGRCVDLYADEACQLDQQDTIIQIETPDANMTKDMYKLLNQWGISQTRVRETIRQLAIYGDAFWANSITDKGVERVIPLQQLQVTDRIEFNPIKALEMKKRREGFFGAFSSNNYLIDQMLQSLEDKDSFADLFDTKLFGFSIDTDLAVPAWSITHFRVGSEGSQFYPFGTPPILGALAPYKQTQSTIALQALAREMNFPVTTFEVKTDENMDEGRQFAVVNRVREAYDNIGVSQKVGNSEVYTVNTKIWLPKDLLTVSIHKAENTNVDSVEDIKLYQDRTAVALGIPKAFFGDEGWFKGGITRSGRSLIQQYKPFARKVFSIQSAFLESLADLFRIHFAITGQYDFRVPFTLSMKYPVLEEDDGQVEAQKSSIEVANSVVGLVKSAIGAGDDDALPADIIRDILGKYTFLDAADIMKWTRDAKYYTNLNGGAVSTGSDSGSSDLGLGGGDTDSSDLGGEPVEEGSEVALESKKMSKTSTIELRLREYELAKRTKAQKLKEAKLIENYKKESANLYFEALKLCAVDNIVRRSEHVAVFNQVNPHMDTMLEVLADQHKHERFTESYKIPKQTKKRKTVKKVMEEAREEQLKDTILQ